MSYYRNYRKPYYYRRRRYGKYNQPFEPIKGIFVLGIAFILLSSISSVAKGDFGSFIGKILVWALILGGIVWIIRKIKNRPGASVSNNLYIPAGASKDQVAAVNSEKHGCKCYMDGLTDGEQEIAHITDKNAELDIEMTVEQGMGYVSKEVLQKNRVDIGTIALDAIFTPIRRVSYEVENMRVGDRTDFNRLKIFIETDGTITSKEALETSIQIMIGQLKAIVGFKEEIEEQAPVTSISSEEATPKAEIEDRKSVV